MTADDDRIGYLAGEPVGSLDPEQRADLDELRALLADPSVWADPAPGLEERIVSAITTEPAMQPKVQPTPAAPSRHHRRRLFVGAAAVAAAIGIAVGLTIGLSAEGAKPRQFSVALGATDLAPGATGSATLTQSNAGWNVQLHATGLVRRDNGRFYEAWLKNPAGTLVPIGTFNQGPNITLWAGVSPQDFPTLTITEQVANGNPASSGLRVLVGVVKPQH